MIPNIEKLVGGGGPAAQGILGGLCVKRLWRSHNEGPVALGLIGIGVSHLL